MAGLRARLERLEGCFSGKGGFSPDAERELTALAVKRINDPLTGEEHARMLELYRAGGPGISEPLPPAEQAARLDRLRRRWGLSEWRAEFAEIRADAEVMDGLALARPVAMP